MIPGPMDFASGLPTVGIGWQQTNDWQSAEKRSYGRKLVSSFIFIILHHTHPTQRSHVVVEGNPVSASLLVCSCFLCECPIANSRGYLSRERLCRKWCCRFPVCIGIVLHSVSSCTMIRSLFAWFLSNYWIHNFVRHIDFSLLLSIHIAMSWRTI